MIERKAWGENRPYQLKKCKKCGHELYSDRLHGYCPKCRLPFKEAYSSKEVSLDQVKIKVYNSYKDMGVNMSKIFIFFIISCIMISSVYAGCKEEIAQMAKQLEHEGDIKLTVFEIDRYLHDTNKYTFYWLPRNICVYWESRKGDCSDMARVEVEMLNSLNITSRVVHGIADFPHSWVEFRVDNKEYKKGESVKEYEKGWLTIENNRFYNLKKLGVGVW